MTYIHDESVFPDDESGACVLETEYHQVSYPNELVAKQVLTYCENLGIELDYYLHEFDFDAHEAPDEDDF